MKKHSVAVAAAQKLADRFHEPYYVIKDQRNRFHVESESFLQTSMGRRRYYGARCERVQPEVEYHQPRRMHDQQFPG